jgi:DNA-binding NtrC family response regulator
VLRTLSEYLRRRNHRVHSLERATEALGILDTEAIDIVITDVKMPDMDGYEVLREVKRTSPDTEVIMITAFGDIAGAVNAMRQGAFDFFSKPLDVQALDAALRRTVRFQALRRERDRAQERLDQIGVVGRQRYGLSAIIGHSTGIQEVRDLIDQVSRTDATTCLVLGETGTGKELVARAIHYESARSAGPFVAVDCSAIPPSLIESELFGHVEGAFTGAREDRRGQIEMADGGTLFLDEIGDMELSMQVRLLRTLEERRLRPVGSTKEIEVDVRVVSATNQNLAEAVSAGRFREDLYYRINAFTIEVPPLRERQEDILPLAETYLCRYAQEMRKPIAGLALEVIAMLQAHSFPGNVRELRNLVERAAILCAAEFVEPADLRFDSGTPDAASGPDGRLGRSPAAGGSELNLAAVEEACVREALDRAGGSKAAAARLLGISRDAIRRRMAK